MMNRRTTLALAATAISVASGITSRNAMAQKQPVTTPILNETKRMAEISIRNIQPSIMAWWLDPAHNEEPELFKAAHKAEGVLPPLLGSYDVAKPKFGLPPGVDNLVAVNPQNKLIAFGTEAGIGELVKLVNTLDKPMRQVEIEAQYIVIPDFEVKNLGVTGVAAVQGKDSVQFGFVQRSAVTKLLSRNKAKIITAPRILAINNLAASLSSTTSRPIILGPKDGVPAYNVEDTPLLYWNQTIGVTARPQINDDDTVNLTFAPGGSVSLDVFDYTKAKKSKQGQPGVKPVWQRQLGEVHNLENINNGQTIALLGLDVKDYLPRALNSKAAKGEQLVILVTPRIIRRAGDDTAIAASETRQKAG